jgi:hypothetical protein
LSPNLCVHLYFKYLADKYNDQAPRVLQEVVIYEDKEKKLKNVTAVVA